MSLASEIAKRNSKSSPNQRVDELGIPVPSPETPEYWVARALLIDGRSLGPTEPRIHGLHLRNGVIFRGRTPLREDRRMMLGLTHLKRNVKAWEEVEFWRRLKPRLPTLKRQILEIAPNLYWDIEKAELIGHEEAYERATPSPSAPAQKVP